MANVFDVDAAILAKLQADTALTAIATDGVIYGDAKANALRFVTVMRIQGRSEVEFQNTAWMELLYQVKAVIQSTSAVDLKAAAARIDAVMAGPLTPTGYQVIATIPVTPIRYTEVDTANTDLRWQHGGGQWTVWVIPTN